MSVEVKSGVRKGKIQWQKQGPASFIERELHRRGLVFGTDGSGKALSSYLAGKYPSLPPSKAQRGDIVSFNLGDGCGGRIGLVESVDRDGHLVYREWREGRFSQGHATPSQPLRRRDGNGRVLNSFLRPVVLGDLPGTRYLAGEMICGLFHVR